MRDNAENTGEEKGAGSGAVHVTPGSVSATAVGKIVV